jgi:DNA-binding protein H-NS
MPKLSPAALRTKIEKLQKQLAAAEANKAPAIKTIFALMKRLGITLDELVSAKSGKNENSTVKTRLARRKVSVKYRDSNGNTWTGRGKTPRWLVEAEKAGKNRDAFRV